MVKKFERDDNVIILGEGQYAGLNKYKAKLKGQSTTETAEENILDGEDLGLDPNAADLTNETTAEKIVR